jgi:hypothetical protein
MRANSLIKITLLERFLGWFEKYVKQPQPTQ